MVCFTPFFTFLTYLRLNEFDAILNLEESKLSNFGDDVFHSIPNNNNNSNSASNTKTISRSSTENFSNETDKPKSSASPRFRRKNQVLKAATSIPSCNYCIHFD